ncbi:MAG: hypothetical protein OXH04_04080, partial [Acidobacteria bacterium]|nr:hypothetical protein [Acidobacteriota bacterium]
MRTGRRAFVRAVGAAAAGAAGAAAGEAAASAGGSKSAAAGPETTAPLVQPAGGAEGVEAFAFDAYGTLFDVFSVTALCEELFPGNGDALSQRWRAKQLQYSLLRSLMG